MNRAQIPATGREGETLLAEMATFADQDVDYAGGRSWSMVYWPGEAHYDIVRRAHDLFLSGNALNPMAFKSLKRMETETVQMCADLLHGPKTTVGSLTSGGTESLLLSVFTYRERARRRWPWILRPNAVVPETIHPAFDKAAHLFGVRLKKVKVDASGAVDPKAMKRKIDRNTIFLAASAPQYVTGTVDPIPAIGRIAAKKGLPFHVDACFGGFIQPFLEDLGVAMPTWDFRIPGVTSMSADLHKYGYAPKGVSVLLYRDMSYMRHQFFVETRWPGGIYVSPGIAGSRPGGPIAAGWASLMAMGRDGYRKKADEAWDVAQRMRAGLQQIPGITTLGQPHSTIVTWRSTDPDVDTYALADQMLEKGWGVDRQQSPPSIHCTINAANGPVLDTYLADLAEAVETVRANPELAGEGEAAMYGMMAKVPVKRFVGLAVRKVMEGMYAPDASEVELGDPLDDLPVPQRVIDFVRRIA